MELLFCLPSDMVRVAFTNVSAKYFQEFFNLHKTAKVNPTKHFCRRNTKQGNSWVEALGNLSHTFGEVGVQLHLRM